MKIILLILSILKIAFGVSVAQYIKKVPGEIYSCYGFDSLIGNRQMKQYYFIDVLTKLVHIPKATMTTKIHLSRRNGNKLLKLIAKYTYQPNE